MNRSTDISTIIGVIAGGLTSASFSRQGFNELGLEANELKQETNNLRRLTTKLIL